MLALFTPAAVPGLTLGCVIANVANIVLSGTGMLGMLDVVFGSLATFLGALFTWKMRSRPLIALAGPVLANALIVPGVPAPAASGHWFLHHSLHVDFPGWLLGPYVPLWSCDHGRG